MHLDETTIGFDYTIGPVAIASNLHCPHDKGKKHSEKDGSNGNQSPSLVSPDISPGQFKIFVHED